MKFIDLLNVSATMSGGVLTPSTAASGGRTLAQAIADGDVALTDTALALVITDGTNRELGLYNVGGTAQAPTLTRTQVLRNNAGGTTAVSFASGATLTAYSDVPASFLNGLISSSQGVAPSGLSAAGTLANADTVLISQDGSNIVTATLSALKTFVGGTAGDTTAPTVPTGLASSGVTATAATLSWTASTDNSGVAPTYEVSKDGTSWTAVSTTTYTWNTLTASTVYTLQVRAVDGSGNRSAAASLQVTTGASSDTVNPVMSGSITSSNITPVSLTMSYSAGTDNVAVARYDVSVDTGTANWINNGTNLSYGATGLQQNTAYTERVRAVDTSGNISNVLTASVTTAAQSITVTNPGTQTTNQAYTLSGTWTGTQPAALDFQTTDNAGTPTAWTAASGPTINANGTWSFSVTPATASTSRTISVRDHTTLIFGTSTAYVVNAAATMASQYKLKTTNGSGTTLSSASFATTGALTASTPDSYAGASDAIYILDANGDTPASIQWAWGNSPTTPPTLTADSPPRTAIGTTGNTVTHSGTLQTGNKLGSWVNKGDQYYGLRNTGGTLYAWGPAGTHYLWALYPDGSWGVYDDNTGTAKPWVVS